MTMVMLDYTCVKSFMITHNIRIHSALCSENSIRSLPESVCYWLQLCYIAMTMVMLDYMRVQTHVRSALCS